MRVLGSKRRAWTSATIAGIATFSYPPFIRTALRWRSVQAPIVFVHELAGLEVTHMKLAKVAVIALLLVCGVVLSQLSASAQRIVGPMPAGHDRMSAKTVEIRDAAGHAALRGDFVTDQEDDDDDKNDDDNDDDGKNDDDNEDDEIEREATLSAGMGDAKGKAEIEIERSTCCAIDTRT